MLHGHGDNGYRYDRAIRADFSSNVWQGGEPPGLKTHLFGKWHTLVNRYPEVLAESLARRISECHGLCQEQILVTAGTTESIYLLAQLHRNQRSSIVIPGFSEYEDACRIQDHQLDFLPWDQLTSDTRLATGLLWLCNPNNPTGAVFPELESLVANNPRTLFIVDEAFIEFTEAIPSIIGAIDRHPNLVILRSLTKAYAIPGLRLGYIAARPEIIAGLQALKWPWSVNAFALEAGHYIFSRQILPSLALKDLLRDKQAFVQELSETGLDIVAGHTHFFLCRTQRSTAKNLQRYLLEGFGLLIRDASNFRGLGPGHFRLATLGPEKNQWLAEALKSWQDQNAKACKS
jgi:threonine-phosphate decarboxylase